MVESLVAIVPCDEKQHTTEVFSNSMGDEKSSTLVLSFSFCFVGVSKTIGLRFLHLAFRTIINQFGGLTGATLLAKCS